MSVGFAAGQGNPAAMPCKAHHLLCICSALLQFEFPQICLVISLCCGSLNAIDLSFEWLLQPTRMPSGLPTLALHNRSLEIDSLPQPYQTLTVHELW